MREQLERVLELVAFRMKDGATREQLLDTVDAVSDWARSQPGFLSRDLSYDAGGDRWIEVVYWASMADAQAAAKAAGASEQCAPMFALIDMDAALMLHGDRPSHRCRRDPEWTSAVGVGAAGVRAGGEVWRG